MPYDPMLVQPMRDELTQIGIQELRTSSDVEQFMKQVEGSALVMINSVCGCAAGNARPGIRMALQHKIKPQRVATVFAGQDLEATTKLRGFFSDLPPSSPSFVLFKDGKPVHFVPRHRIEGRTPQMVSEDLTKAFDQFCAAK